MWGGGWAWGVAKQAGRPTDQQVGAGVVSSNRPVTALGLPLHPPGKRGLPVSSSNMMQPALHISISVPYRSAPKNSSGGLQGRDEAGQTGKGRVGSPAVPLLLQPPAHCHRTQHTPPLLTRKGCPTLFCAYSALGHPACITDAPRHTASSASTPPQAPRRPTQPHLTPPAPTRPPPASPSPVPQGDDSVGHAGIHTRAAALPLPAAPL